MSQHLLSHQLLLSEAYACCIIVVCFDRRAEFKEIRLLGTGNFSKVHLAQHRLDGVNYAVKRSAHRVCSDAAKRQWVQVSYAGSVLQDT